MRRNGEIVYGRTPENYSRLVMVPADPSMRSDVFVYESARGPIEYRVSPAAFTYRHDRTVYTASSGEQVTDESYGRIDIVHPDVPEFTPGVVFINREGVDNWLSINTPSFNEYVLRAGLRQKVLGLKNVPRRESTGQSVKLDDGKEVRLDVVKLEPKGYVLESLPDTYRRFAAETGLAQRVEDIKKRLESIKPETSRYLFDSVNITPFMPLDEAVRYFDTPTVQQEKGYTYSKGQRAAFFYEDLVARAQVYNPFYQPGRHSLTQVWESVPNHGREAANGAYIEWKAQTLLEGLIGVLPEKAFVLPQYGMNTSGAVATLAKSFQDYYAELGRLADFEDEEEYREFFMRGIFGLVDLWAEGSKEVFPEIDEAKLREFKNDVALAAFGLLDI